MERMDTLKDILCRLQMVLLELKQQAKLRRELEAKYREKMEWHRSMRKGPLKMVSSGREINQLKIELQLKETSPLQATDLDGPSSLITNSVFSKGFGHLPYAFCNLPRTPHVPMCRYPQFSDEASRLRTFRQNWCHGLDPGQLAASGFFYTGPNDLVRCFWCGVGFKDWTPGDNPWYQHIKLSRNCGFPESALNPEDLHAYKEQIRAEQTPSQRGLLGTQDGTSPSQYPNYAPVDVRVSSFNKWPKVTPTAWALAEAGLFYTGVNDSVRCFHCNGGMRNWDDGADPWMEHARWFPSCGFVRQQKGDEYIRLVQLASDDEDGAAKATEVLMRQTCLHLLVCPLLGGQLQLEPGCESLRTQYIADMPRQLSTWDFPGMQLLWQ